MYCMCMRLNAGEKAFYHDYYMLYPIAVPADLDIYVYSDALLTTHPTTHPPKYTYIISPSSILSCLPPSQTTLLSIPFHPIPSQHTTITRDKCITCSGSPQSHNPSTSTYSAV